MPNLSILIAFGHRFCWTANESIEFTSVPQRSEAHEMEKLHSGSHEAEETSLLHDVKTYENMKPDINDSLVLQQRLYTKVKKGSLLRNVKWTAAM